MSGYSIAHELRAWNPSDLVAEYERGSRQFRAINLLREELEAIYREDRRFRYRDHPEWERCNPLWLDYIQRGGDFSWDRHGHCLCDEAQDLPVARDLSRRNLAEIDLQGSYLYPIDFSRSSLQSADLRRCIFVDCDLSFADVSRADLRDAWFDDCVLEGANFYLARMDRCRITSRRARSANFKRAKLKKATLLGLDLHGATLQGAHFDRTVLNGSDLRGIDLSTVRLLSTMVDGVTISSDQQSHLLKALDIRIKPAGGEGV